MNTGGPLKRHPALVPLSRQHHHGLLLVWKIRQGIRLDVDLNRIRDYILFFWDRDLKPHFRDEEQQLFILLPESDTMRIKLEQDHRDLESMLARIEAGDMEKDFLSDFAEQLEQHIRYEERVGFNRIQSEVPDSTLSAIAFNREGKPLETDDSWPDPFWTKGMRTESCKL